MNKEGNYENLNFLKVKEVLAENHQSKTLTLLATDKHNNKVIIL